MLSHRVWELEDALQELQTSVPRPALQQETGSLPTIEDVNQSRPAVGPPQTLNLPLAVQESEEKTEAKADDSLVDSFGVTSRPVLPNSSDCHPGTGTLTLGLDGEERFIGTTACSEVLSTLSSCHLSDFLFQYMMNVSAWFQSCTCSFQFIGSCQVRSIAKLTTNSISVRLSKRISDPTFLYFKTDIRSRQEILNLLPPFHEAIHLCELYQEYGRSL